MRTLVIGLLLGATLGGASSTLVAQRSADRLSRRPDGGPGPLLPVVRERRRALRPGEVRSRREIGDAPAPPGLRDFSDGPDVQLHERRMGRTEPAEVRAGALGCGDGTSTCQRTSPTRRSSSWWSSKTGRRSRRTDRLLPLATHPFVVVVATIQHPAGRGDGHPQYAGPELDAAGEVILLVGV